jgi:hypothetical protein
VKAKAENYSAAARARLLPVCAIHMRAMTQIRQALLWFILTVLAAIVTYAGFRGYLSPEMLFNFANSFYC